MLTDSGGIQEETTYLGVPCFTLRDNTERPVTIRAGTNTLLGLDPARIREIPALLAARADSAGGEEAPAAMGRACGRQGGRRRRGLVASEAVRLPGLVPRDRVFFDLFNEAGQNTLRAARMLQQMLHEWPDDSGLAREILLTEQEGDRITHDIVQRTNTASATPIDGEDIYGLATKLDDIVDFIEETADFMGLYKIEAPLEQAQEMADVLVKACEQLATILAQLRGFEGLAQYWIEIHRLENEGDRLYRDAVAALFANGIDPMVVIRWKDIFTVLERAIDATESAAHILEGIVIKNA